ncbi:MAG: DUF5717 family protein [Defluviitaleaceae bacterium]|nr:DUF5717 family protein [Defluviitaleaceae bacterium]
MNASDAPHLEYPLPKLSVSGDNLINDKLIIETTPAGTSGALVIKNAGGQTLEGSLVSAGPMLVLDNTEFRANQFRLAYKVPAGSYAMGEIVHTSILLTTSGGERVVPVIIKVVPRVLELDGARLGSLKDFAAYARKQPQAAAAAFVSDEFANWLKEHDTEHIDIYESMRAAPNVRLALESFLVMHKLKNPVALSVHGGPVILEHEIIERATTPVHGVITLQRQLWGSFETEAKVKYSSAWLSLAKDIITEEDFAGGNTAGLAYSIDPTKIRSGRVSESIVIGSTEIGIKVKAGPAFECRVNNAYLKTGSRGALVIRNLSGAPASLELSVSDSFIRLDYKDTVLDVPPGGSEVGFTAKLSPIQSAQMLIKKQPTISGELHVRITQGERVFNKNLSITIGELDQ